MIVRPLPSTVVGSGVARWRPLSGLVSHGREGVVNRQPDRTIQTASLSARFGMSTLAWTNRPTDSRSPERGRRTRHFYPVPSVYGVGGEVLMWASSPSGEFEELTSARGRGELMHIDVKKLGRIEGAPANASAVARPAATVHYPKSSTVYALAFAPFA
jgi:hypothetical protein